MNLMVDFAIQHYETGPQKGQESLWSFRFGKCDDFKGAISQIKTIPLDMRFYYEEDDHRWEVVPTMINEQVLRRAFDNFESCLLGARSQMKLF